MPKNRRPTSLKTRATPINPAKTRSTQQRALKTKLGRWLRACRNAKRWSRNRTAVQTGCKMSEVEALEAGTDRRVLDPDFLSRYMTAMDYTIHISLRRIDAAERLKSRLAVTLG
jgi:hypothetical protein